MAEPLVPRGELLFFAPERTGLKHGCRSELIQPGWERVLPMKITSADDTPCLFHCPPQTTAFALGNCDTLWHKVWTATWYELVRAVFQVCF